MARSFVDAHDDAKPTAIVNRKKRQYFQRRSDFRKVGNGNVLKIPKRHPRSRSSSPPKTRNSRPNPSSNDLSNDLSMLRALKISDRNNTTVESKRSCMTIRTLHESVHGSDENKNAAKVRRFIRRVSTAGVSTGRGKFSTVLCRDVLDGLQRCDGSRLIALNMYSRKETFNINDSVEDGMSETICNERNKKGSVDKLKVSFSNVKIREYPMVIGDNPAVSRGPPLTLDWEPQDEQESDLDTYETHRPKRRPTSSLYLPSIVREDIAVKAGASREEVRVRTRDVNRTKRKRLRTLEMRQMAMVQERLEILQNVIKSTLKQTTRRKERLMIQQALRMDAEASKLREEQVDKARADDIKRLSELEREISEVQSQLSSNLETEDISYASSLPLLDPSIDDDYENYDDDNDLVFNTDVDEQLSDAESTFNHRDNEAVFASCSEQQFGQQKGEGPSGSIESLGEKEKIIADVFKAERSEEDPKETENNIEIPVDVADSLEAASPVHNELTTRETTRSSQTPPDQVRDPLLNITEADTSLYEHHLDGMIMLTTDPGTIAHNHSPNTSSHAPKSVPTTNQPSNMDSPDEHKKRILWFPFTQDQLEYGLSVVVRCAHLPILFLFFFIAGRNSTAPEQGTQVRVTDLAVDCMDRVPEQHQHNADGSDSTIMISDNRGVYHGFFIISGYVDGPCGSRIPQVQFLSDVKQMDTPSLGNQGASPSNFLSDGSLGLFSSSDN